MHVFYYSLDYSLIRIVVAIRIAILVRICTVIKIGIKIRIVVQLDYLSITEFH